MRLLWIATKSPWPTVDGGRLLLFESLRALAASGVRTTLVAPSEPREEVDRESRRAALEPVCDLRLVRQPRRSRLVAAARSLLTGRPWSVARHESRPIREAVGGILAGGGFDLVVAEQLQAFAQSTPAVAAGVPRLLRAQNVESDLWKQLAAAAPSGRRVGLAREARRLAVAEGRAVRAAAATVALSSLDALRLSELANGIDRGETDPGEDARTHDRIEVIAPPFPRDLPASERRFEGDPALVLFGSSGWEPNARASRRFLEATWPRVLAELPRARLHLFGSSGIFQEGVIPHAAPSDSRAAFARGALLVLPLDLASGVRMRILEAWSRGMAVLASPAAASGLRITPGEELLLAASETETLREIRRFVSDPALGERVTAAGRARLEEDHAPERFASRFREVASDAIFRRHDA